MKCENTLFRTAFLALFLLFVSGLKCHAQQELTPEAKAHIDSTLSVSFITCGPGGEAYSIYGHTALHFIDHTNDTDVAVNWGIFDFNKPNFVGRFVFGLTDYLMGIYPFEAFLREYEAEGRWVKEQQLNLTRGEAAHRKCYLGELPPGEPRISLQLFLRQLHHQGTRYDCRPPQRKGSL